MAQMKEMTLGKEGHRLQHRFEAQNAFSHMNAANPISGVTTSGFGTIIAQLQSEAGHCGGEVTFLMRSGRCSRPY